MILEKTLESLLDYQIKPVNPKGNQSWIFIGRTDAEAKVPILWPPDAKNWLIGKDPDAGKDWRQEEKGMTEDEMVGRHHWFDGHQFEQALGVGDWQGSLVCYSPRCHKVSDMTEQLNWTQHLQTDPCFEMRIVRYSRRTWQTSVTEAELCDLGQGLANCSPHTQSSPLSVFVSRVLLVHSHDYHFCIIYSCFFNKRTDLSICNRDIMAWNVWNIYHLFLFRKSVLTPGPGHFSLHIVLKSQNKKHCHLYFMFSIILN